MNQLNTLKLYAFLFSLLLGIQPMFSQKKKGEIDDNYRRSSLHVILLEDRNFDNAEMVLKAYHKAPFPEKYNDHRLEEVMFNPLTYKTSRKDKKAAEAAAALETDGASNENAAAVETDEAATEVEEQGSKNGKKNGKGKLAERKTPEQIEKYFVANDVARQMVAKWFNRQADGSFDMSLIHKRGSYDATALEAEIAKGSIRGVAALKDAGEELIKNTFIAVNKMNFVKNEIAALAIREAAYLAAEKIPNSIAQEAAKIAANRVYEATKDGYSVWTTSYLYQLEWNDDIANEFYMNMWVDKSNIDPARVELFNTTDVFKMKYIGFEKAKSLVLIGEGKEMELIIEQATVRNIDKVYTKLQKAYDVFKTKTPIYGVNPIWAKIGLKEGVEPNDKFEVLEQVIDKKTGLTVYKQVAVIKVDKKKIWDNRYNLAELEGVDTGDKDAGKGNKDIEGTYFKGGGKIEPGMLLRQVK